MKRLGLRCGSVLPGRYGLIGENTVNMLMKAQVIIASESATPAGLAHYWRGWPTAADVFGDIR